MRISTKLISIFLVLTAASFAPSSGKKYGSSSSSSGVSSGSSTYGSGSVGGSSNSFGGSSSSFGGTSSSQSFGGGTGSNYRPYAPFVGGRHYRNRNNRYRDNDIVCPAYFNCSTGGLADGIHVCRTQYSPISGDPQDHVACVDESLAWTSDTCGCCGDDCFEDFSFQELNCTDDGNTTVAAQRNGGTDSFGLETICRDIFNPFTGEQMPMTLNVPKSKGLPGDICGCCNGDCPESPGEQLSDFFQPTTCSDADTVACELPYNKGSGVFVCREFFDPYVALYSEKAAVCIPAERGWATDECGCCGDDCPDPPVAASVICEDETDDDLSCELNNGDTGTFVCRSLFHPIDGQIRSRSLCVRETFVSDYCGCCDEGCPDTPENGFEDEIAQLLMLALEDPQELEAVDFQDVSSAVGGLAGALFWLVSLVGSTILVFAY